MISQGIENYPPGSRIMGEEYAENETEALSIEEIAAVDAAISKRRELIANRNEAIRIKNKKHMDHQKQVHKFYGDRIPLVLDYGEDSFPPRVFNEEERRYNKKVSSAISTRKSKANKKDNTAATNTNATSSATPKMTNEQRSLAMGEKYAEIENETPDSFAIARRATIARERKIIADRNEAIRIKNKRHMEHQLQVHDIWRDRIPLARHHEYVFNEKERRYNRSITVAKSAGNKKRLEKDNTAVAAATNTITISATPKMTNEPVAAPKKQDFPKKDPPKNDISKKDHTKRDHTKKDHTKKDLQIAAFIKRNRQRGSPTKSSPLRDQMQQFDEKQRRLDTVDDHLLHFRIQLKQQGFSEDEIDDLLASERKKFLKKNSSGSPSRKNAFVSRRHQQQNRGYTLHTSNPRPHDPRNRGSKSRRSHNETVYCGDGSSITFAKPKTTDRRTNSDPKKFPKTITLPSKSKDSDRNRYAIKQEAIAELVTKDDLPPQDGKDLTPAGATVETTIEVELDDKSYTNKQEAALQTTNTGAVAPSKGTLGATVDTVIEILDSDSDEESSAAIDTDKPSSSPQDATAKDLIPQERIPPSQSKVLDSDIVEELAITAINSHEPSSSKDARQIEVLDSDTTKEPAIIAIDANKLSSASSSPKDATAKGQILQKPSPASQIEVLDSDTAIESSAIAINSHKPSSSPKEVTAKVSSKVVPNTGSKSNVPKPLDGFDVEEVIESRNRSEMDAIPKPLDGVVEEELIASFSNIKLVDSVVIPSKSSRSTKPKLFDPSHRRDHSNCCNCDHSKRSSVAATTKVAVSNDDKANQRLGELQDNSLENNQASTKKATLSSSSTTTTKKSVTIEGSHKDTINTDAKRASDEVSTAIIAVPNQETVQEIKEKTASEANTIEISKEVLVTEDLKDATNSEAKRVSDEISTAIIEVPNRETVITNTAQKVNLQQLVHQPMFQYMHQYVRQPVQLPMNLPMPLQMLQLQYQQMRQMPQSVHQQMYLLYLQEKYLLMLEQMHQPMNLQMLQLQNQPMHQPVHQVTNLLVLQEDNNRLNRDAMHASIAPKKPKLSSKTASGCCDTSCRIACISDKLWIPDDIRPAPPRSNFEDTEESIKEATTITESLVDSSTKSSSMDKVPEGNTSIIDQAIIAVMDSMIEKCSKGSSKKATKPISNSVEGSSKANKSFEKSITTATNSLVRTFSKASTLDSRKSLSPNVTNEPKHDMAPTINKDTIAIATSQRKGAKALNKISRDAKASVREKKVLAMVDKSSDATKKRKQPFPYNSFEAKKSSRSTESNAPLLTLCDLSEALSAIEQKATEKQRPPILSVNFSSPVSKESSAVVSAAEETVTKKQRPSIISENFSSPIHNEGSFKINEISRESKEHAAKKHEPISNSIVSTKESYRETVIAGSSEINAIQNALPRNTQSGPKILAKTHTPKICNPSSTQSVNKQTPALSLPYQQTATVRSQHKGAKKLLGLNKNKMYSQYNGVSYHKRDNRWCAQCQLKDLIEKFGKKYYASFKTEIEAAKAIDEFLRNYGGPEHLYLLNFPSSSEKKTLEESQEAFKRQMQKMVNCALQLQTPTPSQIAIHTNTVVSKKSTAKEILREANPGSHHPGENRSIKIFASKNPPLSPSPSKECNASHDTSLSTPSIEIALRPTQDSQNAKNLLKFHQILESNTPLTSWTVSHIAEQNSSFSCAIWNTKQLLDTIFSVAFKSFDCFANWLTAHWGFQRDFSFEEEYAKHGYAVGIEGPKAFYHPHFQPRKPLLIEKMKLDSTSFSQGNVSKALKEAAAAPGRSFPTKFYQVLVSCGINHGNPEILSWMRNILLDKETQEYMFSVVIWNTKQFLECGFTNSIDAFSNWLVFRWGFQRDFYLEEHLAAGLTTKGLPIAFYHPYFQPEKPGLVTKIRYHIHPKYQRNVLSPEHTVDSETTSEGNSIGRSSNPILIDLSSEKEVSSNSETTSISEVGHDKSSESSNCESHTQELHQDTENCSAAPSPTTNEKNRHAMDKKLLEILHCVEKTGAPDSVSSSDYKWKRACHLAYRVLGKNTEKLDPSQYEGFKRKIESLWSCLAKMSEGMPSRELALRQMRRQQLAQRNNGSRMPHPVDTYVINGRKRKNPDRLPKKPPPSHNVYENSAIRKTNKQAKTPNQLLNKKPPPVPQEVYVNNFPRKKEKERKIHSNLETSATASHSVCVDSRHCKKQKTFHKKTPSNLQNRVPCVSLLKDVVDYGDGWDDGKLVF